jgi:hypothetical protein
MSLAVFSVCEQPAAKTNSTMLIAIIAIPVICPILLIRIKKSPILLDSDLYCDSYHSEAIYESREESS